MSDKPPRKFYSPTPRSVPAKPHEPSTVPPPFDIEAFARETTAQDSSRPQPDPRPQVHSKLKEPEPDSASALLRTIHASMGPGSPLRPSAEQIAAMRECFAFGDYAEALTLADLILAAQPDNAPASEIRAKCCTTLEDVYAFRLGPLDRVPVIAMAPEQTGNRAIDNRTGVLLPLIDGFSTVDTIIDACGMPRLDALRALHDLVQRGVVAFE